MMSTNSQEQNVFDVDCIDLTDEPILRNKANKKMVLLVNTDKPVEEIKTLINNAFKKPSPKGPVLTQQKPSGTRIVTNTVPTANKKVAEFGSTTPARTPLRKETTPSRKNVVVLSSTVINPGKPQKPTQSVNPGVSDIVLTPSSSDIRNKKFPMNATNKSDDDATFMALNAQPTPNLSALTADPLPQSKTVAPKPVAQLKTGTPKPVATISTPPIVPKLQRPIPQLATSTQLAKPAVPAQKQNVASPPFSSQVSKLVCASTDLQNANPVKQVSTGRKIVHILPKSLNEEKQLVQEIKRSPALPQLQSLCVPTKSKSREEVLKALREVSASARVAKPEMQPISVKKLVQNPFSRKGNCRIAAPAKAPNEKEKSSFFRSQARKTYQKEATNVSSPEFSHYVRSADAYTYVTAPQQNRQMVLSQSVSNATSTQDNPTPSTSHITPVHSESVQQSASCAPLILNSLVNKPLQNIVRPSTVRPVVNNRVIHDPIGYTHKEVTRISTNQEREPSQVRDEALPRSKIPLKNVMTTKKTVTEKNPFHSTPTTQINPESFEQDESPSPVLQAVTRPQQSNEPNVIPTTSAPKSVSRSILRNPLNRADVRKRTLQFCAPPTDDASPAVNLTDLAETVSAVANINGQTSEAEKANQIVYLLYPLNNKTGTVLPFKEGQIQQMVALVPSDSGLVPLTVAEKKEVEQELGCGDYPLLPMATKFKETSEEAQFPIPIATPVSEIVEDNTDDVILINDDADIEIEPPAPVRPVDISKIINRFNKPFPKGRCRYHSTEKKTHLKFFKGFTCREKQNSSCLREMRTFAKQYKKKADKMKQEVNLRYESNIIYCPSNESEFLPETVKVEIKEEAEDVEVVTILDDKEDAASEILPTIGDVISQVNREVLAMNQPRKISKESDVPPEEALELIKKGLEMIKHWSQENGTASKLETIIRHKLEDPVSTTQKQKTFLPQKRTRKTDEDEQVVKKKRGRKPKTNESAKRPISSASGSAPNKALRRPAVMNATGRVAREKVETAKATSVPGSVRKRPVGRPGVTTTDRSAHNITVAIPSDKMNSRKAGNLEDGGDDLLFVKRVDILKSSKRGRRRKQNLS